MRALVWGLLAASAAAGVARAQDRPPENQIFGGQPAKDEKKEEKKSEAPAEKKEGEKPAPEVSPQATPPPAPGSEAARDEAALGARGPQLSTDVAPDNPLTIGGQFYLRAQASALEEQNPQDWAFASPSLLDVYFDARPNNRVRGFVLGRMQFDPTVSTGFSGVPGGFGGIDSATTSTTPQARGPQLTLDQLWMRFDIQHTVFVTAGRQHVRWGTARFWTPSDFLHVRQRNPLDVFDARTGSTMLKLHVPWEARGWNFYAYGVTEGAGPGVGDIAGAARAEVVVGTAEAGIGAMVQRDRRPKLAADLSAGLGPIDVYGELALRYASEIDRIDFTPEAPLPPPEMGVAGVVDAIYPVFRESGVRPQVTAGFSYSQQYADKDVLTLGGEYFYNSLGYDNPDVYPGLLPFLPRGRPLENAASFFYLGRHYAAIFLVLPAPGSWDLHFFTLSTLGNLSDRSFISRFDYALTLLTHLRFEAFASVHYGRRTGEFRFGIDELHLGPITTPARAPGILDVGVALRVSI
jgi:hypothetical protein